MSTLSMKYYVTIAIIVLMVCNVYWITRHATDVPLTATVAANSSIPARDGRLEPCGFDIFRALARQRTDGYVPGSGTWTHNSSRIDRFQPSVCRLNHGRWIPDDELATCLRRKTIRYIAIIGDSNGRFYLYSLYRLFSMAPAKSQQRRIVCGPVVRHVGLNYKSYLSQQALVKHRCPCDGYCTVEIIKLRRMHKNLLQARCTVDNVTVVVMEYIAACYTMDNKIWYIPSRTGCQRSPRGAIEPSRLNTTQAFLLGEYFSNPRPDVMLVFSNAHDQMALTQYAANVEEFAQLIDQLVPPSTQVVWASKHAEDERKMPLAWRNKSYVQEDGRRLTRLQWLNEANRILYAKMRQRFIDGRRMTIMFPDLFAMSQPALNELNKDGVHMHDHWYQSVLSFIFQSLCYHSSAAL